MKRGGDSLESLHKVPESLAKQPYSTKNRAPNNIFAGKTHNYKQGRMIDIIKETSDDMHGTATKQERGTSDYKV